MKEQIQGFVLQLPKPSLPLHQIFDQLKLFSKQCLQNAQTSSRINDSSDQIRGLKFISSKLAKLFIKNRKLPYNQISKILIDNFASQQNDQRNIKRRVYDAINVLVAAGVLIKKNNFVEMTKNKIKLKVQSDKRVKTQQQIVGKQQMLKRKKQQQMKLIQKKKAICKLFERNIKNKSDEKVIDKMIELRKSKTRKKNDGAEVEKMHIFSDKNQNNHNRVISEPRLAVVLDKADGEDRNLKKLIRKYQNVNKIQLKIPLSKDTAKQKIEQNQEDNEKYQMELQESNQRFIYNHKQPIERQETITIKQNKTYPFIDIIELLPL